MLCMVLTIFQAWNMCLVLWNPLPPQYMISCHKFLLIRGRSPSHVPYVVFLTPGDFCIPRAVFFFPFLSFFAFYLRCLSLTLALRAQTEQSHNWCFAYHSKFHFCGVWLGSNLCRAVIVRGEGKSNTCAIWRQERYIQ